MNFQGLPIRVEYPRGSKRPWKDDSGQTQYTTFQNPYGEIPGTTGVDGDPVDVYVGPNKKSDRVFVVKQMKRGDWKKFDEEKMILGCSTAEEARDLYLAHYNDARFCGGIKELSMTEFKDRLLQKGLHGVKIANAAEGRATRIADRIDDVGIGVLASPYIAKGIAGQLQNRPGRLGMIGRGARAYAEHFDKKNRYEIAGLGMVAPGLVHSAANVIDRRLPVRRPQVAAPAAVPATVPAAPAKVAGIPKTLRTLGNAAVLAGVGTAIYGGKKAIDRGTKFLRESHAHPIAPPAFESPRNK
jgi:hypothetical protein